MRDAITAIVHVGDLYKSLSANTRRSTADNQIKAMIKADFERQGILFLDKPGLYPVPPCHMRQETSGAFPIITIKQGRA